MKLDLNDLVAAVGVCLLSYGAWLVYEPAAFIVAGSLLVVGAVAAARK